MENDVMDETDVEFKPMTNGNHKTVNGNVDAAVDGTVDGKEKEVDDETGEKKKTG